MKGKFSVKGVPEFTEAVKLLASRFPTAARKGLYLGLEFVMTDSKMNYVPVKDGILRSSGFVLMAENGISGVIGFGGPAGSGNMGESNSVDVNYAAIQHENLDFAHTVGQAKYLQTPLFAGIPKIGEVISLTIKKELGL